MKLLSSIALLLLGTSVMASQAGLAFLRVDFPDGTAWTLGKGGIGRPFMARLLLVNQGTVPVTIWDYKNSEGAQDPGVILTDKNGKETILRPPPIERAAGVPTVITIQPHQVLPIDLELLRLIGERGLPSGKSSLKGFYENKLKNDGTFIKTPVWLGRIESEPVEITIVVPKLGTKTSMKGWELYIWRQEGQTNYSLMVGTNWLKTDAEITQAAVRGIDVLKPKLDELQSGEQVFLHGRRLADAPPPEQAKLVQEYCQKVGLEVPLWP